MSVLDAAFAKADRVLRASIDVHRHHPMPMECRAIIASWDAPAEHMTIHASTQSPHMLRMVLPAQVGVPMERIRVLAADVGGGFGLKNGVGREDVAVVAASVDLGRPVKCGFCTPGFVMTTVALLADDPTPDPKEIRKALSDNICRCTGYQSIVQGVSLASERLTHD